MISEHDLSLAVNAVTGVLLSEATATEEIRFLLLQEPQQYALRVALVRTYTTFARYHSQWLAHLFDNRVIANVAAPYLAHCLVRHEPPDPTGFAFEWAKYSNQSTATNQLAPSDLLQPASDFLHWFNAEVAGRRELVRFLDTAQSIQAIPTAFEPTSSEGPKAEFMWALQEASKYETTIQNAKGVVFGENATVTNVFNTLYRDDFATLQEFYVPPDAVFQRVRVDEFEGRAWLETDLDQFLLDNDRGVWLLVGEAGIGKTSFLAHLVRERSYIHVFSELLPGETNIVRVLQSLASQIIVRYRIEPYSHRDAFPQNLSSYPDFFARLIRLAAARLGNGESLVIVIDALDEAGTISGGNVLGLPRQLPQNVYLVLSQRPQPVSLYIDPPFRKVTMSADDISNQQDIRNYLTKIAEHPRVKAQLYSQTYTADQFVKAILNHSEGNWMYVHYLVEEVRRGVRAPLDLSELPVGLAGYYAQFWARWRIKNEWYEIFLPLLATLAAAQEPISVENLRRWAAIAWSELSIQRLLREDWGAFIYEMKATYPLYRLYHASLRDFLAGEVQLDNQLPSVTWMTNELRSSVREAHKRIVEDMKHRCNGKWAELSADKYSHQYLSTHLRRAGYYETLFQLSANRDWYEAQMRQDPSGNTYRADIEQASIAASEMNRVASTANKRSPFLSQEIYCYIVLASLNSYATSLPPELLPALVASGMALPSIALQILVLLPDSARKGNALAELAPYLPSSLVPELVDAIRSIEGTWLKAQVLADVLPLLSVEERHSAAKEIHAICGEIQDDNVAKVQVISKLIPYLERDVVPQLIEEAIMTAQSCKYERGKVQALSVIIPYLPSDKGNKMLSEAIEIAGAIEAQWAKAIALSSLLSAQEVDGRQTELLEEALRAAKNIEDPLGRCNALVRLLQHLSSNAREAVALEIWNIARSLDTSKGLVQLLAWILPNLPEQWRGTAIERIRERSQQIGDEVERVVLLTSLAPLLTVQLLQATLTDVLSITNVWSQDDEQRIATLVTRILSHLPAQLLQEAVPSVLSAPFLSGDRSFIERGRSPIETVVCSFVFLLTSVAEEEKKPALLHEVLIDLFSTRNNYRHDDYMDELYEEYQEGNEFNLPGSLLFYEQNTRTISMFLTALLTWLPPGKGIPIIRQVLEIVAQDVGSGLKAHVIQLLSPFLQSDRDLLGQALEVVRSIKNTREMVETLASLLVLLSGNEHNVVESELRRTIESLPNEEQDEIKEDLESGKIKASWAANLESLQYTLSSVGLEIELERNHRTSMLRHAVWSHEIQPALHEYTEFRSKLALLARGTRPPLLLALQEHCTAIALLGGDVAVNEVAATILRLKSWWP